MKKVLVSGSSGMLGIDLVLLLKGNYEVVGLDTNSPRYECSEPDDLVIQDITDRQVIEDSIGRIKPDMIVHTAAWTDVDACEDNPDKAYNINALGTHNLALIAAKIDVPILYISTDFVFDGQKHNPYDEHDRPNPINIYGKSKLQGEEFVLSAAEKYFIVRTSWLFGKCGRNFVDSILTQAESKKRLKVVADQFGSPTYTKDLASAVKNFVDFYFSKIESGSDKDIYGIYHVTNSDNCSWFKFAKAILQHKRLTDIDIMPITSAELTRAAERPKMSILNNSKYQTLTQHALRTWDEALADYLSCSVSPIKADTLKGDS